MTDKYLGDTVPNFDKKQSNIDQQRLPEHDTDTPTNSIDPMIPSYMMDIRG